MAPQKIVVAALGLTIGIVVGPKLLGAMAILSAMASSIIARRTTARLMDYLDEIIFLALPPLLIIAALLVVYALTRE
jgi:hypothetical protein